MYRPPRARVARTRSKARIISSCAAPGASVGRRC
nr:MAG TPA: hypothetical protein [Caudoviricetes sp.]